jgi:undecaprenyl-diphosphatase
LLERVSSFAMSLKNRARSYEPIAWMAFGIASIGVFIFVRLMDEMLEGETRNFDESILRALRQPNDLSMPIGPSWVTHALTDITSLGGTTVLTLMTALTIIFLLLSKRTSTAVFVLIAVVGGWLVSNSLKLGVARPRPDIVPHLVEVHDLSFPSGHAMLSAVTYLTLGALLSRTQASQTIRIYFMVVAVFLTLLIGMSRVFLGVHYPTDVIGGWCAGAAWASACWLVARVFLRREKVSVVEDQASVPNDKS